MDLSLKNGSSYSGTINGDNTAKTIKITLDSNSSITLTGDSYITSLENADGRLELSLAWVCTLLV